ncbi:MAG: hypothetical protein ACRDHG_01400 [Anaerolineales bacterium]
MGGEVRSAAQIEVPGFAEIVQPGEGQALQGIVTIRGTAAHPAFEAFELSFSLDPDPTETWFPLGEAVDTPVVDGRLAIWDTGPISDGNYRLRLQVRIEAGEPLVAIVQELRVRNYTPTELPVGLAGLPATAEPEPTQPAQALEPDRPAETRPDLFRTALTVGAVAGVAIPTFLALYQLCAPRARAYSGFLRMRRLHRRTGRPPRR